MRAVTLFLAFAGPAASEPIRIPLTYAPAPPDNPLKGLVPYAGADHDRFPHSMEFDYLPLSALVVGPEEYDWKPLERLLDDVAGRGRQAIFRVYMEYPDRDDGIPEYLLDSGLKIHEYLNTNTQPLPPAKVRTPDYEDPRLRRMLKVFIREFGRRYDGDPRIGYITAGLLGTWGEWHTYPREELFASKAVQAEVMDAYQAAFARTPVLLRYPAGSEDPAYADNSDQPFGYHDDSFAWATLETGRPDDDWHFMSLLRRAGPAAQTRWRGRPVGGEIRPEAWGRVFDPDPADPAIQDIRRCVEATHATWLMDSGMFEQEQTPERYRRAVETARRLGYDLHIPAVAVGVPTEGRLPVRVEVVNRGVAPFYADWNVEYGLQNPAGEVVRRHKGAGVMKGLLPDSGARVWDEAIDLKDVQPGSYSVLLRAVNPLPGGRPLRFANAEQGEGAEGWITLGAVRIR